MRRTRWIILSLLLSLLMLSACRTLGLQPPGPSPSADDDSATSTPPSTSQPEDQPTAETRPTVTPPSAVVPAGTASLGEVLYTDGGQIWAINVDTLAARQLTDFSGGAVIRGMNLSPDGRYLAFTINSDTVALLDLSAGELSTVAPDEPVQVSALIWSPTSDALFYQRIALEVETSTPVSSSVVRLDPAVPTSPEVLTTVDFDAGEDLSPRFALPADQVVLLRTNPLTDALDGELVLYSDGAFQSIPLEGVNAAGFVAAAPGGDRLVFTDPADLSTLTLAAYDPQSGISALRTIVSDDNYLYGSARFAPDGERIFALRRPLAAAEPVSSLVLLVPGSSAYTVTELATGENAFNHVAFSFHGDDGIIVQRLPAAGGVSELWLLPLDGSSETFLTEGEFPVTVSAR